MPYRERGYWYYTRFETGQDYPIYARRQGSMDAAEEILLDVNAMAQGKDYFSVGDYEVSQDNKLLAWAEDDVGRRQYTIRFKNLATGEIYADEVHGRLAQPGLGRRQQHPVLRRERPGNPAHRAREEARARHAGVAGRAGVRGARRQLLHGHRPHPRRQVHLHRREQHRLGRTALRAGGRSEGVRRAGPARARCRVRRRPPRRPLGDPHQCPAADGTPAKNFKIVTAPTGSTSRKEWKDWIAHRDDVFIEGFELFDGFTAIAERSDGLERLRVLRATDGKTSEYVKADEPAYSMGLSVNAEPDTTWLRYSYTSMTTPGTTYELNTRTGERKLLKRDPVLGYDPDKYVTERVWATARDGVKVPVSLVYRKGFKKDGNAAMLQYAYGSYGASTDPGFNGPVVSLLDRGMVYAHRAHPRRPGDGPQVVRRRQAVQQEEHLHRLHRRHRLPGEGGLCRQGPRRRATAAAPAAC